MKCLKLTVVCLILIVQASYSQLGITPHIGFENARTRIKVNDGSFFKPIVRQSTPQLGIKFDYQFKKGNSVFAGISTSNNVVSLNFDNSKEGINKYSSSRRGTKLRLEGGYQFNSKFSYGGASSKSKAISVDAGYKAKNKKLAVRYMEQIGLAFIPSVKSDFENNAGGTKGNYTYNAGNWNLAILYAWGFEFNKGNVKKFYVNIQYLKAVGNLGSKTLSTGETKVKFTSRASALSLNFGIPFSLCSKKAGS